jgi:hypothetical protein
VKKTVLVMVLCLSSAAAAFPAYAGDNILAREGDKYRVYIDRCRQVDVPELVMPVCAVAPGSTIIDSDKAPKEALFVPVVYAGIDNCEIVLRQDPGPTTRLPIKGAFSRYGIFDFRGVRFLLKVIYPDSVRVMVTGSRYCCRAHWR